MTFWKERRLNYLKFVHKPVLIVLTELDINQTLETIQDLLSLSVNRFLFKCSLFIILSVNVFSLVFLLMCK